MSDTAPPFSCEFCERSGSSQAGFGAVPWKNGAGAVEHCPRHLQAAIDSAKRNTRPAPPSSPVSFDDSDERAVDDQAVDLMSPLTTPPSGRDRDPLPGECEDCADPRPPSTSS